MNEVYFQVNNTIVYVHIWLIQHEPVLFGTLPAKMIIFYAADDFIGYSTEHNLTCLAICYNRN